MSQALWEQPPLLPAPGVGRYFESSRRVGLAEVDPSGRYRLDAIADALQVVSNDDVFDAVMEDAMAWVVRKTALRIHANAQFRDELTLATWCSGTSKSWAARRVDVRSAAGLLVEAETIWVYMNPETGAPRRLGPQFDHLYRESALGRKVNARVSKALPPASAERMPWSVRRCDLDLVGHVNNTVYWCAIEEAIEADFVGWKLEMQFLAGLDLRHSPELLVDRSPEGVAGWIVTDEGVHAQFGAIPPG